MATSREAQGWQISVIIFALLTVVLAITTYVFYSQSETARKEMLDAVAEKNRAEDLVKKLNYKVQGYKYVIGKDGVGKAEVDQARTSAGQEDEEVKSVVDQFERDMETFGADVAPEIAKNYRTLPEYLLAVITKQNEKVVDMAAREKKLLDEKDGFQTKETDRTKVAEAKQATAEADLTGERGKFNDSLAMIKEDQTKLQGQLASKDKVIKDVTEKASKDLEMRDKEILKWQQLAEGLKGQVAKTRQESKFEVPDGVITWVNQQQRLTWINLGSSDGLNRQTTFSVYNYDQAGVSSAKPKGRIEVIRITGTHVAECRILEDDVANPIMPKDLIHSPAWSPGQEIHFALVGFMDIDEDGQSDRDTIKRIITLNGGIIDAELKDEGGAIGKLSINTRYLIQGDKPNEKTGTNVLAEYNNMLTEVQRYNVEVISIQKFMAMMGWQPEEKKIDYRGAKDLTGFRNRPAPPVPGVGAPAAGGGTTAPPPLTTQPPPLSDPKPVGGGADPFDPFK